MEKVVLIGLGAVGLTYAVKLRDKCDLSILVDKERLERYMKNKPVFNGDEQDFNYILPSEKFDADLIIITTKFPGLASAVKSIRNFVSAKTRIISLINGVSSEDVISKAYPKAKVLKSYFIGHSAVRRANFVKQDGIGEIVIEHDDYIENFFTKAGINYSVPDDIDYAMWLKFAFNSFANPISAILNMKFGELKKNKRLKEFAKKVIFEVRQIAKKRGIKNTNKLEREAVQSLDKMCDEGMTSMHQDILSRRPTEIDIFCGEIIKMGRKYGIKTPYSQILYDLIKIKEEDNEHSIHTCQGRE